MSDEAEVASRRAAGELEAAVLAVLQEAGTALSPGEVRERIGGALAYTTVVTILSRLHAKGVLERHKAGRADLYAPVADQPGLGVRRRARAGARPRTRPGARAGAVRVLAVQQRRGTAAPDARRTRHGRRHRPAGQR